MSAEYNSALFVRGKKEELRNRSGQKGEVMDSQMEDRNELSVNGFRFETKEEAEHAKNELKAIHYIKNNVNMKSGKAALEVYKTLLEKNLCKTPIGYTYLRELQKQLLKHPNLPSEEITDIPVEPIRNQIRETIKTENIEEKAVKNSSNYKKYFFYSMVLNITMAIAVAIMLWVATTGDHVNILNYENQIINKYELWELELEEREKAVKSYEKEYGISK